MKKSTLPLMIALFTNLAMARLEALFSLEERVGFLEYRMESMETQGWKMIDGNEIEWQQQCHICECNYLSRFVNCWRSLNESVTLKDVSIPYNVEFLDLTRCHIPVYPPDLFNELNKLKELSLVNTALKLVPKSSFHSLSNLLHLKVSDNEIKYLPDNLLDSLSNLLTVDFSYNEIRFLPDKLFALNWNLTQVNLAYNQLKSLPGNLFSEGSQVQRLDISGNKLEELSDSLTKLDNLEVLNAAKNELITFPNLRKCHNLKTLDLSHNFIDVLEAQALSGLSHLQILNLAHNKLTLLDPNILPPSLKVLDVKRNRIEYLTRLEQVNNALAEIHIEENFLEELPARQLEKFIGLEKIDMSSNTINDVALTGLPGRLNYLNLSWNFITNVSLVDFGTAESLEHLHLEGNQWSCTCHSNAHFHREIVSTGLTDPDALCSTPEDKLGQSFSGTMENLMCN